MLNYFYELRSDTAFNKNHIAAAQTILFYKINIVKNYFFEVIVNHVTNISVEYHP